MAGVARAATPAAPSCVQPIVDGCIASELAARTATYRSKDPATPPAAIAASLRQCTLSPQHHHGKRADEGCSVNQSSFLRWNQNKTPPRVAAVISYSLLSRSERGTPNSQLYSCGAVLGWVALHSSRFADLSKYSIELVVVHDGTQSDAEIRALRRLGARTHAVSDEQLRAFCLSQTRAAATSRDPDRAQPIPAEACESARIPSSASYDGGDPKGHGRDGHPHSMRPDSILNYTSGALVISHFLKVEAWRFVEYDAVIFFDTDVYVKMEPSQLAHLEAALDFMLMAPTSFGPIFLHEPPCIARGHACVMGGIFLLRPSLHDYYRIFSGILSGFFGFEGGWGGDGNASVVYANLGRTLAPPGTNARREDRLFWEKAEAQNATVVQPLSNRYSGPWSFWAAESDQGLLTWAFAVGPRKGLAVWADRVSFAYHFHTGCCQPQRLYGPRTAWCNEAQQALRNATHGQHDTPYVNYQRTMQMADRARRASLGLRAALAGAPVEEAIILGECAAEMEARLECTRDSG